MDTTKGDQVMSNDNHLIKGTSNDMLEANCVSDTKTSQDMFEAFNITDANTLQDIPEVCGNAATYSSKDMPEVCRNTVTNVSKDMQETWNNNGINTSKEMLEALNTNTNTSKEMQEEFNNSKTKTSKDMSDAANVTSTKTLQNLLEVCNNTTKNTSKEKQEAFNNSNTNASKDMSEPCNNTIKNTSKEVQEAFKNASKELPEAFNLTDAITPNYMPEAVNITGTNTSRDISEAFNITNTNTSQGMSKALNITDTKNSEDMPEPVNNVGNKDEADFTVDTDIHIDHHPPFLMNDETCIENVDLPKGVEDHQNEIVEIHLHTLQDLEKSFNKNSTNLAEDPTDITLASNLVVIESQNDGPSTSEMSIKQAQNTELRIVDAYHITSSRAQKTTIEDIMLHTHKSDTLNDSLNQCQSERDDVIDTLPEEIQAELSIHAEYHRLKSNSTERFSDLNNYNKMEHMSTECYSTIAPKSENAIKREIHETAFVQCKNTSRSLACDTNYFGSESSTFLVSNASARLDQLTQEHVIEELTASSELRELGLDDSCFDGFTQVTDKEGPTAHGHCSKNTESCSGSKGKAKNVKSSAETTLVDSSSISKIKSLWAKTCASPKPYEVFPGNRGSPKSSKIDKTRPVLMSSGENSHRKCGRPKGSGGKKTMTIQSCGEDSPRKRGRPKGSWCNKTMTIQSPGVFSSGENSPRKIGRPIGSGGNQSMTIQSFPGVLNSGDNSPRMIGRPKGSGGNKSMTNQSFLGVLSCGEDSPRKIGRPKGSGGNKSMTNQSPGVLNSGEDSPRKIGRPKGSGGNKSMTIQSPAVLNSGEDSPRRRGRPKGSGGNKSMTIQFFPGVLNSGKDSPRKRGRPKGGNKTLPTTSVTGILGKYEILPRKRGRPKANGNSQKKAIQPIAGPLGEKRQNILGTVNVEERVTERINQNFKTEILLKEGVMARENQSNVEEKNIERELNMIRDSELLDRFNMPPCKVRLPRLNVSGITFCVARREGIGKRSPTGNQCNRFDETSLKHIESPKIYDTSGIKSQKLIENSEGKDNSKAEQMKREKNNKLYEMKLKLEYSIPEITINDDVEDDCDGNDIGNVSDDEYTPTNNSSLRTAFVKSQKIKKGNQTPKRHSVKRKIDYAKTEKRLFKKTRPCYKTGTGRIGAPPKFGHFECKKCDFTANEKNLIQKHHKREHARPWIGCNYCEYKSRSPQCLLEHGAKVHKMGKPFKCSYDGCLYASTNRTDLHHHKFKHATEKSYSCPKCNYVTKWKKNVRHHQVLVHSEVRNFKCDICMFTCKRKTDLKQHKFRHTSDKPKSCTICGFRVKTNWELKSHMLIHSDEKPFRCKFEGCKAAAKTNADLLKHVRQVHTFERTFVCSLCGKAYKDQQGLNKHHNYVHVSTRTFICDICSKAFKCKPALKKHILFHEGFKPHRCPVCKKTFAVRNGMKKHLETHDFRGRPFRCPLCPYGAKESGHLLAHIGTFHGDSYCYFCELCYKPFQRHGMLRIHYQRMHKSNLPSKKNNGDQIDLALVKMEKELQEEDLKRRKRKKGKRNKSIDLSEKIKEEQLDDGYESVSKTTEFVHISKNGSGMASDDVLHQSEKGVEADDLTTHIPLPEPENRESVETVDESSTDKENKSVNADQESNQMELKEEVDEKTLKMNTRGTATLAIYDSLRLSLATKGFSFNYGKNGKKPKAWFMDVDCMNPSDADRQKTYLRKVEQRCRKRNECKNLSMFLKQRTENRNKSIWKSKMIRSLDKIPKQGRPCKTELSTNYEEAEQYEQKRGIPRRVKFKGEYSELDTEAFEEVFSETDRMGNENNSTNIIDKSVFNNAKVPSEMEVTDNTLSEPKKKRGRPKKVCQINSFVEEDMTEISQSMDQTGVESCHNEGIKACFVTHRKKKRGRPKKVRQTNSSEEEGMTEGSLSTNQTSVESCHADGSKADFVTHHKKKQGRPKKVCQMILSEDGAMTDGSQNRKETNFESCHAEFNKADFVTHHKKKQDRPKKVCQVIATLEEKMPGTSQSMTQMNGRSSQHGDNRIDFLTCKPKKKRGRPKKVCQMNTPVEETTSGRSEDITKQTNVVSSQNEGYRTDLMSCSKNKQVKHKRKLQTDDSEHQIVKPKWQKKYIPVKMRKKGIKKDNTPKTSRKSNSNRIKPLSKDSKFVCEGSLRGETSDPLHTNEKDGSHFVQTDETGHTDKQKLKSNNQGATSFVKPDLTNYCDDVLAMKTTENIHDLFGGNIKLANDQNIQPCMSNGTDSAEADALRMQSNYLNYKINLNPPENRKGSHGDMQCTVNGPTDDGTQKSVINETFEKWNVKIEPPEESEVKNT